MAVYDISTLGTSTNQIVFNDDSTTPYYRMKSRTATVDDLAEFDIKLPEASGIADFESQLGKGFILLDGVMYPDDETGFDNGRKALRRIASVEISQDDTESDDGYVPYKWSEADGYNKQLFVKVMRPKLPESTSYGLKQPFKLMLKVKDPVIYGQGSISTMIGDSNATTTGGIGYPFSYPVAYGANTYSSNGSLNNPGDLKIHPQSIQIFGPINVPRITSATTGEYIEVNVNLATGSDSLIITYDKDSVSITQNGVSKLDKLSNGSTLFKLRQGTNNFTLTGSSIGSGAYATLNMLPAWPLD